MLATKANTSFPPPEPQQDGGILYTGLFFYKLGTQEYCCKIQLLGLSSISVEDMQDDLVSAINDKLCKDHPWDELQQIESIEPRAAQYEKGLAATISDVAQELMQSETTKKHEILQGNRMQWPDVVKGFREIFAAPVSPMIMEEILRFFYPVVVKFSELNYKEGYEGGLNGGRVEFIQYVESRIKQLEVDPTQDIGTRELRSMLEWFKK